MYRRRFQSEFVRDLVNAVPTSANVKYYAEIVADKAMMRKLIKLTESIANTCYVGKESLPVIMEQTRNRYLNYYSTAIPEIMFQSKMLY